MGEAWIIDALRTRRGKKKLETGSLPGIHPQPRLSQHLNALRDRAGMHPEKIEGIGS